MTIVEFLRARLDEDVEHAEGVRTADWESRSVWEDLPDGVVYHARHFDPARVLAEVASKRRIVDAYAEALRIHNGFSEVPREVGNREALEMACRLLALPYADASGYDEAWRP